MDLDVRFPTISTNPSLTFHLVGFEDYVIFVCGNGVPFFELLHHAEMFPDKVRDSNPACFTGCCSVHNNSSQIHPFSWGRKFKGSSPVIFTSRLELKTLCICLHVCSCVPTQLIQLRKHTQNAYNSLEVVAESYP